MNKVIMIMVSIIIILTSFIIGMQLFSKNEDYSKEETTQKQVASIDKEEIYDDCTDEWENNNKMIEANSQNAKVSPNCNVVINKKFTKCGHITKEYTSIPQGLVNKTEKEVQDFYSNYVIESFSTNQIVLNCEKERRVWRTFYFKG